MIALTCAIISSLIVILAMFLWALLIGKEMERLPSKSDFVLVGFAVIPGIFVITTIWYLYAGLA